MDNNKAANPHKAIIKFEVKVHQIYTDGSLNPIPIPEEELAKIPYPYEIFSYEIPGQSVARCCILIKHKE